MKLYDCYNVDVVIPFCEKYTSRNKLRRAKSSAKSQEGCEVNVIVIDDSQARGASWARNQGIKKSRNQFIAFLDADDYWKEDKLLKQIKKIKSENADLCITGSITPGKEITNRNSAENKEDFIKKLFFEKIISFTSTILMKKSFNVKFDESFNRREDFIFLFDSLNQGKVCWLGELLTVIEKSDMGLSRTIGMKEKEENYYRLYKRAVDHFPCLKEYKDDYFRQAYHRLGRMYYYRGNFEKSVKKLSKSLEYGFNKKTLGALVISKARSLV